MNFLQNMDLKKILILSAGIFAVFAVGFFFFLKGGSGEVGPITAQAQEEVANNKSGEALQLLIDNEKSLDQPGLVLLEELKEQYYKIYLEEAQTAANNADYLLAYEKYSKLIKIVPKNEDVKKIEDTLRELEKIVEEIKLLQEAYTKYMSTFESALQDSNLLLKDFKTYLNKLEVSMITTKKFSKHFKGKIDSSNEILNKLDTALSINNADLLSIHKDVVNLMNTQHSMFLMALTLKSNEKVEKVEDFKSTYLSIKEEQIELIQNLNNFATENHLKVVTISEDNMQNKDKTNEQENPETDEKASAKDEVIEDKTTDKTKEKDTTTKDTNTQ
ncbi:hypothetical protein [Viridibacillus arvi]|uniref:hypothetical protein n=1 Tax=Viridibacillus arvi TaxID=263475 RepID=UPI0034CF0621